MKNAQLTLLFTAVIAATSAVAADKAAEKKGAAKTAPAAAPVAAPAAAPAKSSNKLDPSESSASVMARINTLYTNLEYDKVIPIASELLKREDLTLEQKLDAFRLLGSCTAIVEDPVDAEKPFRLLLRAKPDYEFPPDTPPRILSVFRKVQTEEKALASQLREVERNRIVAGLKLIGEPPTTAKGGRPLPFSFRLRDPTGAVESMRLPYRQAGQSSFSSLALQRSEEGDWKGVIPGEFTSNEKGFVLEYYVETLDAIGPLLTVGAAKEPKRIDVTPGTLEAAKPPPLPRWAFFTGAGVTAVLGLGTTALGISFNNTQADYKNRAAGPGEVPGDVLATKARQGEALATATNAAMIATGVSLLVTAVMTPFVNWANE